MRQTKKKLMRIPSIFLLLFISIFINSCSTSKYVSTVESNTFEEKTNQTTFNNLPLGSVTMPGKWTNDQKINFIEAVYKNKTVGNVVNKSMIA